jgi:hypothetical protein
MVIWKRDGVISTVSVTEFEIIGTETPADGDIDPPPVDELALRADEKLADVIADAG